MLFFNLNFESLILVETSTKALKKISQNHLNSVYDEKTFMSLPLFSQVFMLFYFLYPYAESFKIFNLLRYITFRTLAALMTALLFSFAFGGPLIRFLKSIQKQGQPIRDDGPQSHLITKKGTPTMGGLLILGSLVSSTLLWGDLRQIQIQIVLFVTLSFGALGAFDDFLKLTKQSHNGLSGKKKLCAQCLLSLIAVWLSYDSTPLILQNCITFPFLKDFFLYVGWFYILWALLVIVGSSNAVNLTDGLDGLAIGPAIITSFCFAIFAYVIGHIKFSEYLHVNYIPHAGELCIFLGAFVGAGLGFLWFNAPPAKIFMGDTGSLAIGGAFGTIGILLKQEIVLAIIGGLFVFEAISVILQVLYYKTTKKRIFLMAPIHHHFEKKGWAESTIVIRFWIISIILGIIGLSTLKIR